MRYLPHDLHIPLRYPMRTLTYGLLLLTGMALGWHSHDYWQTKTALMAKNTAPNTPFIPNTPTPAAPASGKIEHRDHIAEMLEANRFQELFDHYTAIQTQENEPLIQQTRGKIIAHAYQLIANKDYKVARQLMLRFLAIEFRNVEAHILLADAYQGEMKFTDAINNLYEARGYAYRPTILEKINRRIQAIVVQQEELFIRDNNHTELVNFYQHLIQLEPSHAPYFTALASAQIQLRDIEAARHTLELVAYNPEVEVQVQALFKQIQLADEEKLHSQSTPATGTDEIALVRSGNHFMVESRLGTVQSIRLLIDTGASLTIITPQALAQSNARYTDSGKTGTFNTANGQISAPIYRLETLSVGAWQINDIEVGILELTGTAAIDGLLGMNFLKHFQFSIDQNNALLSLSSNTK